MKITRLTIPAFDAVSNDQIVEWLRIDPDTDNITLAMLVSSAVETVEGLTGLNIAACDYLVDFDRRCATYRLPLDPVTTVKSVTAGGVSQTFTVQGDTLILDAFPTAPVSAVVTAGYDDPEMMPVSLRHAVAVLVGASYDNREALDPKTMQTVQNLCARHRRMVL